MIETLSGPPSTEISKTGGRLMNGIGMDQLKKMDAKNVFAWKMKKLINLVCHEILTTMDEHARQIESEDGAKTVARKILENVERRGDRIRESLFDQFMIETLSGPPSTEISKTGGRLMNGIGMDQLKKMDGKNVSTWKMKKLINLVCHETVTTMDEHARQIESEDGAKTVARKIFENVDRRGDRIRESLFDQFMIETLSGPPSTEISKTGGRLMNGIGMDQLKKMDAKNVSTWKMKKLINLVCHETLTTMDEHARQIESEDGAKTVARKIFENVDRRDDRIRESLFDQFMIETLSGPPSTEISKTGGRLMNGIGMDQLKKMDAKNVSPWKMTKLINLVCHETLTTMDEHARQIESEDGAKTIARKIYENVDRPGDRIRDSLFDQFMIETLSGPPSTEISKTGGMLMNGIGMDQMKKMDAKNVSAWKMKKLINLVCHETLTTMDEHARQIESEDDAKTVARKIFENVDRRGDRLLFINVVLLRN
ncbi:unnamed protein product [Trifolium pratense]|uniref:Uncharacterized protein n=1 Tax=Trifolium pratense TaxID=57577 RepID=A0ACB0JKX5_TRIPR|nr:unnamed protein product [Trifolium pratense]